MSISEYLYNNVLLLIKVVPPSYDFKKYFSKDMFNKPNTPAFIHVSHYLLNIYDAKRFQTTIKWPVFGKAEEAIYCTEIRNYLTILSSENPDINFPVMLKIHLLKASGKIFLIIMWKLSIIALRAYLKRKDNTNILWAPSEGITNDLVNKSLNNIISHKKATLMSFMDNIRTKEEEFTILKKCELDHMNRIESEIFKTWEHIEILLQLAPVHPMIIKKLRDTERNPEIISMWKEHICHSISYIHEANIIFKELSNRSNKLNSLASYLCTDMILDGSQFHLNPGKKDFVSKFNFNGQLNLQDFVSLLNMTLKETRTSFEVQKLPNVSPLKLEVSKCSDTIKSMISSLRTMHSHVSKIKTEIQYHSQQRNTNSTLATNRLSTKSTLNFHHSPKIKFTSKSDAHCKAALNRICESPIRDKHKHLFSKYKHKQIKPSILLTLQKDNQNISCNAKSSNNSTCDYLPYKEHHYRIKSVTPSYSNLSHSPNIAGNTSNFNIAMPLKSLKPNYLQGIFMTSTPMYNPMAGTPTLLKRKKNSTNMLEQPFDHSYKLGSPIEKQYLNRYNILEQEVSLHQNSPSCCIRKDKIKSNIEHIN